MNKKIIGLDYYELDASYYDFIECSVLNHWQVYDVTKKNHLFFYASIFDRQSIINKYPMIQLHKTVGIIGILLRTIRNKERIISIILASLSWFYLSNTIFDIQIHINTKIHHQLILDHLIQNEFKIPFKMMNKSEMTITLFEQLRNDITWLEIKKQGSRLHIYALERIQSVPIAHNTLNLYAKKDGVIRSFDVDSGYKVVSLDQLVHKGDLLVSNQITSSSQESKITFVDGRVYAYTIERKLIQLEDEGFDAYTYFKGIITLRNEITKDFSREEFIIKEIPLQFIKKEGKIVLEVIFICNEQIAMLGE